MCYICDHKRRFDIEEDVRKGELSMRLISEKYKIKESMLKTHKKNHMPNAVEEAKELLNRKSFENGKNRILEDVAKLDKIIDRIEDPEVLAKVTVKDIVTAMKLKAELLGDIKENEQVVKVDWISEIKEE